MPDLPRLQNIHEGLSNNIQSTTAYATGWTGLIWGAVSNHWLSIISAACLMFTAYWNYRHRKQLMRESALKMELMREGLLDPHGAPISKTNGEID